jgi:hypothetical protein
MVSLRPEAVNAAAMAMPAPKRISMPQGIRSAVCQSSNRPPRPSGTRNMTTTASSATMASLVESRPKRALQPPKGSERVIQKNAVAANTASTRTSPGCQAPTSGSATLP